MLSVKDKNWKYENEWRIILYKKSLGNVSLVNDFNDIKELIDRKVNFNHNYISKIILAPMFFNKELFQSEVNINGIISHKLLPKKNYRDLKIGDYAYNPFSDCIHYVDEEDDIHYVSGSYYKVQNYKRSRRLK